MSLGSGSHQTGFVSSHPSFPSQLCGEGAVLLPKAGPWLTVTPRTISHRYMGLALSYPNPVFCIQ